MNATSDDLFIKRGYQVRSKASYLESAATALGDVVRQPDVYLVAADLASNYGSNWIIDLGCGRAEKLMEHVGKFQIVGIDAGPDIAYCREKYSRGTWLDVDLEVLEQLPLSDEQLVGSVVVCSGVIEKLADPRPLLRELARLRELAATIVISASDRDRVSGPEDIGPPGNQHHIREWNIDELGRLLSFYDLEPTFLGYTMNDDVDWQKNTCLAIIENKQVPSMERAPDDFRVLAVITAYNEKDILPYTVQRLLDQGIEVVVLDNWSTDGTFEIIDTAFPSQVQIIHFPESDTGTYDWSTLLNEVEKISQNSSADWVIHHDADEMREGPWLDVNLRDSVWNVQRRGFNAINHTVITFRPVKGEVVQDGDGTDPADSLIWWEADPRNHYQVKAWKNEGQAVHLAAYGGHEVQFAGRQVFPYRFLLRHYPLRSPNHARQKIFADRRARWNQNERSRGWHKHYDDFQQDDEFLWSTDDLNYWNPEVFHREFLAERLTNVAALRSPQNVQGQRASKLYEILAHSAMLRKVKRSTLDRLSRME